MVSKKLDEYVVRTEGITINTGKEEIPYVFTELKNIEMLTIFPIISHTSLFISVASTFEKCLHNLVEYVANSKEAPLVLKIW
ncbi:hypothetical protein GCM10008018_45790 [Paenibacillus marchantiophytorum]|uniref:Uncharacterized protein n=1 Tax=Paenibacillus marchantiophytorum TaxID=1619310 RepID=A0ABQ1EZ72_9BACL|nr:hypothetical protein GCM10008018_45790 [Paenibacillus marchantiophytorum]